MSDRDWKRLLFESRPVPVDPVREAVDPVSRHDARRRPRRLRDQTGRIRVNLTALIDVTFLLLIFFVSTTRALEGEHVFRVDVPPMEAEPRDDESSPEPPEVEPDPSRRLELREPPLRVRIASSPEGPIVALEPRFATVDSIESLERVLREARRDRAEAAPATPGAGLFTADHPIQIDPDRDCSWEDTVAVFNALLRAGYRNVGFAGARPRSGAPAS